MSSTTSTAPDEASVAIVGTYRGTSVPHRIEYLTPDYDLAERIAYWTDNHWTHVHAAREVVSFTRLTPEQAEAERSRYPEAATR